MKITQEHYERDSETQLTLVFNYENKLKSVIFEYNDTGLESNRELLENIARAILTSIEKAEGFETFKIFIDESRTPEN